MLVYQRVVVSLQHQVVTTKTRRLLLRFERSRTALGPGGWLAQNVSLWLLAVGAPT